MAILKVITKNEIDSPYRGKYQDAEAIDFVIHYATNRDKTYGYIGGWAVNPEYAAYEMKLLSQLYHKDCGVRLRHWMISFQNYEIEPLVSRFNCNIRRVLYGLGLEFSSYYKDQYQIMFAVHLDNSKLVTPHLHFVMNTVSYVDGRKFSGSKADYYAYVKYTKSVANRYGIQLYPTTDCAANKGYHTY